MGIQGPLEEVKEPLEEVKGPQDEHSCGNGDLVYPEEAGVHGDHV